MVLMKATLVCFLLHLISPTQSDDDKHYVSSDFATGIQIFLILELKVSFSLKGKRISNVMTWKIFLRAYTHQLGHFKEHSSFCSISYGLFLLLDSNSDSGIDSCTMQIFPLVQIQPLIP